LLSGFSLFVFNTNCMNKKYHSFRNWHKNFDMGDEPPELISIGREKNKPPRKKAEPSEVITLEKKLSKKEFLKTMEDFIKACKKNRKNLCLDPDSACEGFFVQKLEVPSNAIIQFFGDIHGEQKALNDWIEKEKPDKKPERFYIFLGDYIDRGENGALVLNELMKLYIKAPKNIILLRGNHENKEIASFYGFVEELKKIFGKSSNFPKVWEAFQHLPSACLLTWKGIKKRYGLFCVHGGPCRKYNFRKLLESPDKKYQLIPKSSGKNLLWSDIKIPLRWIDSRGAGEILTVQKIEQYFQEYQPDNLDILGVIRGHQQSIFFKDKKEVQGEGVYILSKNNEEKEWPKKEKSLFLKNINQPFVMTLDFFRYETYVNTGWPQGEAPVLNLHLNPDVEKCKFTRDFFRQKK